ncbi:protein FAR-RED IMPAIRED RESPONSE 1-like [Silene latifolia]|uniref:protein FAR-RED IMPAIRED RESPONSE 1-like n=1 Tax=Silene latifolia TaxID=37657 RepID=UPI003D782C3E
MKADKEKRLWVRKALSEMRALALDTGSGSISISPDIGVVQPLGKSGFLSASSTNSIMVIIEEEDSVMAEVIGNYCCMFFVSSKLKMYIVEVTNVQASSSNSQGKYHPEVDFDNQIVGLPRCSAELKPALWMKFATLEEDKHFYEEYAKAKVSFRRIQTGEYEIYDFVEVHSHAMNTPTTMIHLKPCRDLNLVHKKMIMDNAHVNHGLVQTFRMFKQYVKGYKNVGASLQDFKKLSRDVKKYIKEYDAQMLIENFMQKKAMSPSLYFDFDVDDQSRITKLLWADPISIKNYALFGDAIFVDATCNFNQYKMVFVPFTGVDNHKGCVNFAAGLIRNENAESFSWLFQNFVTAMGDRYPITIITDQCRGLKKAVKGVFDDKTRHRLCMWHIMKKLPDKVGPSISQDTTFLKEINSVVWDVEITPEDFESKWNSIISSYELCDNKWLKKMFKHRALWIHAYIRDIYLGGILLTTSRSESENSFFGKFTNPHVTLVEFWMHFQTTMDAQRWKYSKVMADDKHVILVAIYHHQMQLMFERIGILYRHILWVLKDKGFDHIPKEYLALRWSKSTTSHPLSNVVGKTVLADCVSIESRQNNISELWSEVFNAVSLVEDNEEHSDALFQLLRSFNEKLIISVKSGKSKDKKAEIEMLLGSKIPTEVTVLPPEKCKNKGSGKRITSNKEKAVLENAKPLRKCRACGEMSNHDSRNCPSRLP